MYWLIRLRSLACRIPLVLRALKNLDTLVPGAFCSSSGHNIYTLAHCGPYQHAPWVLLYRTENRRLMSSWTSRESLEGVDGVTVNRVALE